MVTLNDISGVLKNHLGAIGAGAGGLVVGSGLGYIAARRTTKSTTRKRKSSHKSSRKRSHSSRRHKSKKSYSTRKIHYTKNGQPYVKLASGKARFISKRGARMSKKEKGGRY